MLDKHDTLAGKEGTWSDLNTDSLISRNVESQDLPTSAEVDEKINECTSFFLGLTPFEFEDQVFVAATNRLDGEEFAKAVYQVYLKRGCEHQKIDYGTGVLMRLNAIETCRRSKEFNHIWAIQIDQEKRKKPLNYLLERLWIKITS